MENETANEREWTRIKKVERAQPVRFPRLGTFSSKHWKNGREKLQTLKKLNK
ncbi:MAG: hypothetical protein AB7E95_11135 [Kiritimatiellales bacterium]